MDTPGVVGVKLVTCCHAKAAGPIGTIFAMVLGHYLNSRLVRVKLGTIGMLPNISCNLSMAIAGELHYFFP